MDPRGSLINRTRRSVDTTLLEQAAEAAFSSSPAATDACVCLSVVGRRRMRALNRQYHGCPELTDVLAFAQEEGMTFPGEPAGLGDVVVSWDAAAEQAAELGHSVQEELAFLTVHGILHLLGDEDDTPKKKREMLAKQHRILQQLGCTLGRGNSS